MGWPFIIVGALIIVADLVPATAPLNNTDKVLFFLVGFLILVTGFVFRSPHVQN